MTNTAIQFSQTVTQSLLQNNTITDDGLIRLAGAVINQQKADLLHNNINIRNNAYEFFTEDGCRLWCKVLKISQSQLRKMVGV